jgi:hypothetical protein
MRYDRAMETMTLRDRILVANTSARKKRQFLKRCWVSAQTRPHSERTIAAFSKPDYHTLLWHTGITANASRKDRKFYNAISAGIAKL